MKRPVLAGALLLLVLASQAALTSKRALPMLKDRAALMFYEGSDQPITVIARADTANLVLILLKQWVGDAVPQSALSNRSCIGVALFSRSEWQYYLSSGRPLEQLRPRDAAMRLRLFPASGDAPAAVQDISTGTAWVAIGMPYLEKTSIKTHVAKARAPCNVE